MDWTVLLTTFYFFLPAGFSNMAPAFFSKFNFLKYPIDFGLKLRGKPLFGKNKTWRGFFFGIISAIIITFVQFLLQNVWPSMYLLDYSNFILFGFLMGFGALFGDVIESFVKRQINIKPGQRFIFFDQTDWIFGSFLLTKIFFDVPWNILLWGIIIFFVIHIIVKHIGFYMGLQKDRW